MDSNNLIGSIDQELDYLQEIVGRGFATIKSYCLNDGKLDPVLMDEWQLCSYDLAFCTAEISAARSFCTYASALQNNSLVHNLCVSFSGETIQTVLNRLLSRAAELELSRGDILAAYDRKVIQTLLENFLTGESLSKIGEEICENDIQRLPSVLSDDIEMVRETFFRFANDVVIPLAEEIHRQDQDIPDSILKPAAELGCFGTCIPERFGGLQPDDKPNSLGMIVVTEELSRGSLGAAGSLITRPEIAARSLLSGGTAAQQERWLPKLAAGEMLCAISITEPNTGSDVAAVSLKASKTKGGWLLNGSKTWCTFAGKSELLVVLARTDGDLSLGYKGLSLFMIEKPAYAGHSFTHQQEQGGSLTGNAISTLGYRGMHSYDLFFEDYFVPEENLVGEEAGEGRGFYFTMEGFSGGRIQTAARATGVMQAAFENALSYAKDRQVFGKAVADYQLTRVKLTRMLATLTASRQFSYAVAEQMDNGGGQMEASLVKLFTCRAAEWISREALQIHGGMGYAEESTVSRLFVDARVLSIFEGAEETLALKVIARDLIAKA
ncbi:MAG: acyl-CoA/acyl-ACP dehydrogenase [Gammaproteobacteria bacterium]|jgi:(2S)-methylsuccinyl-CoA dehydrogenase|nr:acyl-CoA/acyl-ACP dehydrogenase [Gammaproteobacteria bacterium]MBT3858569.1 acyl-CoA/acyl-ACP dehydrogenase [Gammaproteobacteria bacterium]MBT3986693.1 acyl-CoA/acyl-ACP dehydrogenase [Gammaproteobacteria bacterium]MBT4257019.1 acyl-CoA/acyl-ACP dehydrogenase [Gammaproteobacteria bacterium]MBT4582789.1 acyl-CoA/acyl-ACP dehydrogenase [Gammaproteobacteria bacterium]